MTFLINGVNTSGLISWVDRLTMERLISVGAGGGSKILQELVEDVWIGVWEDGPIVRCSVTTMLNNKRVFSYEGIDKAKSHILGVVADVSVGLVLELLEEDRATLTHSASEKSSQILKMALLLGKAKRLEQ